MKMEQKTISDYLSIIIKWKKIIFFVIILFAISMSILTLFISNKYKATSIVMISPEGDFGLGGLSGLVGGKSNALSFGSKLLGGNSVNEDIIFGILNSRTAICEVIKKFDLYNYYSAKINDTDNVVKNFRDDIEFELTENNFIEISIINKDPILAANISNYFVKVLDKLNNKINSESARNNRIFIENRYQKNLVDLKSAEDSLYNFQKKYGIIAVPEQLEVVFKASAEIEAEYFRNQVLTEIALNQYGEDSPQYRNQLVELNILKQKINQLKNSNDVSKNSNILLPFKMLPNISISYLRIYREVEIQSKILEITLPMYEQAKVEEIKSIPAVIVIDNATVPQNKFRPQRAFIVISSAFLCLFIFIPLVFRMESILNSNRKLKNRVEENEFKLYSKLKSVFKI